MRARLMSVMVMGWLIAVGLEAAQAPRQASAGVYTTAQAERGKKSFDETCTACHNPERFTGPEFVKHFAGQPLSTLWGSVNAMPEDNPGSLPPEGYADIIAYMLSLNGFPAGAAELAGTEDAMKSVTLDGKP
jgi:S-disulfanyl-L-cysteine oxidoreductase SoxD